MPPNIHVNRKELKKLRDYVAPSVVTVNVYEKRTFSFNFCTGFVIYYDDDQILICVSDSVLSEDDVIYVHFHDETCAKAKVFLKNLPSKHVVLMVSREARNVRAVSFSQNEEKSRKMIFTIAEAESNKGFHLMSGYVLNPNCSALTVHGTHVPTSENIFSISCPAVGKHIDRHTQILGAATFGWDGQMAGAVESFDDDAYDLKFVTWAFSWVNELESKLKEKNPKIVLTKDRKVSFDD